MYTKGRREQESNPTLQTNLDLSSFYIQQEKKTTLIWLYHRRMKKKCKVFKNQRYCFEKQCISFEDIALRSFNLSSSFTSSERTESHSWYVFSKYAGSNLSPSDEGKDLQILSLYKSWVLDCKVAHYSEFRKDDLLFPFVT